MLSPVPAPVPAHSVLAGQPALACGMAALANARIPTKTRGDIPAGAGDLSCHAVPCHAGELPGTGVGGRRVFH